MMTLIMLLSTASACSTDYQYPNYWGLCVDGEYKYAERDIDNNPFGCNHLVILVPHDIIGDKIFTTKTTIKNGMLSQFASDHDYGYYTMAFENRSKGPDVDIEFYLDGVIVHTGSYQQNYCYFESGTITTNDPNAVTYEGDYWYQMPGHVIIKSFNH